MLNTKLWDLIQEPLSWLCPSLCPLHPTPCPFSFPTSLFRYPVHPWLLDSYISPPLVPASSTLATSPPTEKKKKKISLWKLCVQQHTPLSTLLCLQMFIVMSHWSGTRPLASAMLSVLEPQWDSSWIFYCCPVSWRSCSFATVEQTCPFICSGSLLMR